MSSTVAPIEPSRAQAEPMTGSSVANDTRHLAEVWSDTVDTRHLGRSLLLSIPLSAGAFLVASAFFQRWIAPTEVARAYAMLVGLLACLLSAMICARLFKPKRHIVQEISQSSTRQDAIDELKLDVGGLGKLSLAPAATIEEMKALGLYQLFLEAEQQEIQARDEAASRQQSPRLPAQPGGTSAGHYQKA